MKIVVNHGKYYKLFHCNECGCEFWYDTVEDTTLERVENDDFKGIIEYLECPECLEWAEIKREGETKSSP